MQYIINLTKRASLNIENQMLYESIYSNVLDTFRSLVASVQVRDHYTEEHCSRVADLSVKIAKEMNRSGREIESLKIAGMLHDVGKIAIPDNILLKPGKLTFAEFGVIKTHSEVGERILKPILLFDEERNIILHHHEKYDGTGYPSKLKKMKIPIGARIMAVADAFDAMVYGRPYRERVSVKDALEEIKKYSGTQFDPVIVKSLIKILHNKKLKKYLNLTH